MKSVLLAVFVVSEKHRQTCHPISFYSSESDSLLSKSFSLFPMRSTDRHRSKVHGMESLHLEGKV